MKNNNGLMQESNPGPLGHRATILTTSSPPQLRMRRKEGKAFGSKVKASEVREQQQRGVFLCRITAAIITAAIIAKYVNLDDL